MYHSGRAGDKAKKGKSSAKSGRVGITASLRSPPSTIDQNAPIVQCRHSSHSLTDDNRRKVESIVSFGGNIITTTMTCIDVLYTDEGLADGNTSGSNGHQQLDELKLLFLESALRQKFESPVFTSQWEGVRTRINTTCRGKRRTVIRRLQKTTNFNWTVLRNSTTSQCM